MILFACWAAVSYLGGYPSTFILTAAFVEYIVEVCMLVDLWRERHGYTSGEVSVDNVVARLGALAAQQERETRHVIITRPQAVGADDPEGGAI